MRRKEDKKPKRERAKLRMKAKPQAERTGGITSCPNCGVLLFSHPMICPLCSCVTEELEKEDETKARELFGENAPYPNVHARQKLLRFILKLVLFIFVVAEVVMVMINYFTGTSYPWSLITGFSMFYIYLFLIYWVSHDSGFAAKVGLQFLITMLFLFEIDYWNGMRGWSLQWAIPSIILLGDGLVLFLMMLNRSRWQSYMLLLLLMAVCSVIDVALYFFEIIGGVTLPLISVCVTSLYFFGAMLFGGSRAGNELSRRFHI